MINKRKKDNASENKKIKNIIGDKNIKQIKHKEGKKYASTTTRNTDKKTKNQPF